MTKCSEAFPRFAAKQPINAGLPYLSPDPSAINRRCSLWCIHITCERYTTPILSAVGRILCMERLHEKIFRTGPEVSKTFTKREEQGDGVAGGKDKAFVIIIAMCSAGPVGTRLSNN